MSPRRLLAAACCGLAVSACGGAQAPRAQASPSPSRAPSGPPAPGPTVLAVSAVPRSDRAPTAQDLVGGVDQVVGLGAKGDFEGQTWKALEPASGRFDLASLRGSIDYMGNQRGLQLLVNLKVIDTTSKEVPPDLAGAAWDSAAMKARFHKLLDALKPAAGSHLRYLSVGNEVDVYLRAHRDEWNAYQAFFTDAAAYAHSQLPGVQVGVTTTFDGAARSSAQQVAALNAVADVVILTYYPLDSSYRPRAPSTAAADFDAMAALARGKPLALQEVGYPSASALGSSEAAQASFLAGVFTAWKQQGGRIPFLNLFALHDLAPATCRTLAGAYGRPGDANLVAYLCSLGLRRADDSPKPAWQAAADGARTMRS